MKKVFKKLSFASADILGGGSFNIINFLYPGFLALTVGLSAYVSGIILLVAKFWDALIDPIIGFISDKTKSKFGKRRVYLIFVSPLVAIGMYFLFFPYNFSEVSLRIIAVCVSYLIFTTIQSFIMVPYYSLSSEISSNFEERAKYNIVRLGFSIFSSILCVAIPGIIVGAFADKGLGYQVMSITFGVLFAISALITGLFTREEIVTPPSKEKFKIRDIILPFKIKEYSKYIVMFLVTQMASAIMSGMFFFYMDFYILKDVTASGETTIYPMIAAALMFAMQIVALPVFGLLIKKGNKTSVYQLGAAIWIVVGLSLLLFNANTDPLIIIILAAIMGFGISGPGLAPHTMFGDIVDMGELQLKRRIDGQMGGFTNFINQTAQAIGLAVAMFIIGAFGFIEDDLTTPEIVLSQPDSATMAIKMIMALTPLILMSIGIVVSFFYKIDKKEHENILLQIAQNKSHEETV